MNAALLMNSLEDKIPKDMMMRQSLSQRLEGLSDEERSKLSQSILMLGLKSPSLIFWVGSFLFGNLGVGRFMAGHIGLGVARLCLLIGFLISYALWDDYVMSLIAENPIGYGLGAFAQGDINSMYDLAVEQSLETPEGITLGVLFFCSLIAIWAWWIVDLFVVDKKVRQDNLIKILSICPSKG